MNKLNFVKERRQFSAARLGKGEQPLRDAADGRPLEGEFQSGRMGLERFLRIGLVLVRHDESGRILLVLVGGVDEPEIPGGGKYDLEPLPRLRPIIAIAVPRRTSKRQRRCSFEVVDAATT